MIRCVTWSLALDTRNKQQIMPVCMFMDGWLCYACEWIAEFMYDGTGEHNHGHLVAVHSELLELAAMSAGSFSA